MENKHVIQQKKSNKLNQPINQINVNKLQPGSMIAADQIEIAKPERSFETVGKESFTKKYCGGTIFYNPATKTTKYYF